MSVPRRIGRTSSLTRIGRIGGVAILAAVALFALVAASRAHLEAPAPGLLLRDRNGRFLGEIGTDDSGEFGYWPLPELPPRVVAATLAVEDRRFRSHPGVDPFAAGRAVLQNLSRGRRVSGASTIAMQVSRMQEPGRRSYSRKAVESLTAMMLTARYGRNEVLAHYLRIAPYGNRIHGIAAAARRYFDKPVDDLSWAETAFLAALPQAPGRMNPYRESGRLAAIARGSRILRLLLDDGALSQREYRVAAAEIVDLAVPPRESRPRSAIHALLRLERELSEQATRTALAARGPVLTTLDLDIEELAERAARSRVASWEDRGAGNAAVLVVARGTREVLASVGSTGYFETARAGAIDFTSVLRSPGSILKPFLYALALDRRTITPATILDDLQRGPGGIANADDLYLGPLLPRLALANSRNVPAAELLRRVGLDDAAAFFREIGLDEGTLPARHYGLGLAIGGMPVRLENLVRAYTALAEDGRLGDLVWYRGQPHAPSRRVISEETARRVTLFLSDPMARLPSFPRMGPAEYPYPVAVKTGTSSNYRDAWAVAWSTRYIVGVWVGDPSCRPMNRLSGFNSAAALAQDVMNRLHRDDREGLSDLSFPPPRGFRAARVCALTGTLATEACPQVFVEWFQPGEEPVQACRAHVRLAIDARSGLLATSRTPRADVEVRTFVDLPPRYAAWAAAAGLQHPPFDGVASPRPFENGSERPHESLTGMERSSSGSDDSRSSDERAAATQDNMSGSQVTDSSDRGKSSTSGPGAARTREARATPVESSHGVGYMSSPAARERRAVAFGARERPRVRVVSPENGVHVLRDPETPADLSTLALAAVVDPPAPQVVWYVDGSPFQVADYPYTARWPLRSGVHVFEARVPYAGAASRSVRIDVQ